ncbi:MAG: hypothetical protein HOI95_15190 [Chromatiales bacterium]|jgi:hypothetical protein|nr:hypothetical protein [Chromatiales bacterium]
MRWLLVLLVIVGGYVGAAHFSGGAFPTFGLPVGGDRAILRSTATHFLEDIQFKDFKKAASYHAPERRDEVDIPFLIQRLFLQKPESLDIMDYEIMFADVDSTQKRARVKARIKVKSLVNKSIKEQELLLFFHRAEVSSPWYMELESSLRNLKAEKGKKS